MTRIVPLFLVLVLCSGCESFFYPSREKYLDLRVVVSKRDGSAAPGVPVKVYPRPGWRAVPVGPAFQQFFPIFQETTDDDGQVSSKLADYFAYTLVAGSDGATTVVEISRKDVKKDAPLKVVLP